MISTNPHYLDMDTINLEQKSHIANWECQIWQTLDYTSHDVILQMLSSSIMRTVLYDPVFLEFVQTTTFKVTF